MKLVPIVLAVCARIALAQDVVPLEHGNHALCATPILNDPKAIQQARVNTQLQHPGIVEAAAVQQSRLMKGTLDYKLGDQYLYWVYNSSRNSFDTVRAELKAIGALSYVWVALGEWNNGHVTQTEVDAMMNALERSTSRTSLDSMKGILQIDRQAYGDPPNVDVSFSQGKGDGKTHFLVCDIQDGWNGSGSYLAGFFYNVDVDPHSGAVAHSNRRDMLYIDSYPGIFLNGKRRLDNALSTLAHEFQHLINWHYKGSGEITFFNEGLSQYAEFLCGYTLESPALYFANTNLPLTGWNTTTNVLDDYSRATIWTRYVAEQYGLRFIKNYVQNPTTGISGFEQSLTQSGYTKNFATTVANFFTANWLGSNAQDSAYRYNGSLGGRPTLKGDYTDPNVQRRDTVVQQGVQYISFAAAKNFRVTFTAPAGIVVRAVESGSGLSRVRDFASGVEFSSAELGAQFSSVVFAVMNTQGSAQATYSYAASGDLLSFIVEESYDSGTPHPYAQGYAPYLGFGNKRTTLGMAVRFQPEVSGNILRKARMMVAFNQEFANGTALPTDDKDFVFHVWGDQKGRPGADIIPPFVVSVDRDMYPLGSFVDIDLSAYQTALTNLAGPVYVGFIENTDDTVGTYLGVDNLIPDDYSYIYRGPNHPTAPSTWQTMREASALNNHSFDGFNLMIRAVFQYSDSSSAPVLSVGYLQNPLLSEYIDVVATSPDDLRAASLSGTITQSSGAVPLSFHGITGTTKAFIDTTQLLKGDGVVSLRVKAAKKFGVTYADTTAVLNARLLKQDEQATLSTPSGDVTISFDAGSIIRPLHVTAFDGVSGPEGVPARASSQQRIFSLGPSGAELNRPSTVRIGGLAVDETMTLAIARDGKWITVPSTVSHASGELVASIKRLGVYAVVSKNGVDVQADILPTQFALYQNYPNPFNPTTTIGFDLPRSSRVLLIIYDVLGREVVRLVDEERVASHYDVRFDASRLPSGAYLYRLTAEGFSQVKKLMVLK